MADARDPKELVTGQEIAISNIWEIARLVEMLERKGILSRQQF